MTGYAGLVTGACLAELASRFLLAVMESEARQSTRSVIASEARQSMTALYRRWIARAYGLAMTNMPVITSKNRRVTLR
ncbi:MAG: hypothetical protein ABIR56_17270 [Polaromonas sp.]